MTRSRPTWRTGPGPAASRTTRLPAFQGLQTLARHADGLDAGREAKPQIEAIVGDRRLLDASDPVPGLAANLTNALRKALAESQNRYDETYGEEQKRLEETESWQRLEPGDRDAIFARLHISKASTGATGSEQEVLESLERISLHGWRTRIAALPHLFAEARAEADKLVEPKIRHVKLESPTLRTAEDVDAWVRKTGGGSPAAGRAGAHRDQVRRTANKRIATVWRIRPPRSRCRQEHRVQDGWTCKLQ